MKLKNAYFFVFLLVFGLVAGCGDPDSPDNDRTNGDNATNTNGSNTNGSNTNGSDENQNNDNPPDYQEDPYDSGWGETYVALAERANELMAMGCECPDILGYASEQDCIEDLTDSSSDIDQFGQCLDHGVAINGTEPPASLDEYLSCEDDARAGALECMVAVDVEYGEGTCSEDRMSAWQDCGDDYQGEYLDCRAVVNENNDLLTWYSGYADTVDELECYDYTQHFSL